MKIPILSAMAALAMVSCEKPDSTADSKLQELEKKADEAVQRQKQLEAELAEQKILAERDAIERERTLIEQERIAMEDSQNAAHAVAANELERRQAELSERERKISEIQREQDSREQKITGLESELSERELELAGREPLDALPPVRKNDVRVPTGDFNNFYEPLGAYGSWFRTGEFGYVYQPSCVRDSTWRPYTRGRWAFTNQGWTWVSSEPFGWACYHYGRWALLRNVGWVWIPGNEWAPAWVTWRESPGYIGWAPLPPETLGWYGHAWDSSVESRFVIDSGWFSYVSYNHFGNDIHAYCLPRSQNIVIHRNTINITHYVIRERSVYVGGPRYRNVCDRIGRRFPIHHLRLDESPEFGRGGRRLSSQFSGNELQVVAPRMDADWNRALRPSKVSRDLGDVVVDRSKELPEDVRKQFRDRRDEEDKKAQLVVTNAGGGESFEKERKSRLEGAREEVAKHQARRPDQRERREETVKDPVRPNRPAVIETPQTPEDLNPKSNDRGSRRPSTDKKTNPESGIPAVPDTSTPAVPDPEIPAIPDEKTPAIPAVRDDRSRSVPRLNDLEPIEKNSDQSNSNRLQPGDVPATPPTGNHSGGNLQVDPATRLPRPRLDETPDRSQLPENRDADLQNEADKNTVREKRQQQDRQEKLNQQLEQKERAREQQEQSEKLREQQKQQMALREQQERLRAQQEQKEQKEQAREQQENLRQQQAQQEMARSQQEETQRRLKEQQDQVRAQQEQQERLRAQQERLRAQQEQQERLRAHQEQQERLRAQQEQQERAARQQQEAQRRMEEQQEQQERAARQQQEAQRRMQQQHEQQERARQQQEESQRRVQKQQQEQLERSRR
jgi:hypothetical protein